MTAPTKRSVSVQIVFGALPVLDGEATEFGLQDKEGTVYAPKRVSKKRSVFTCELTVNSERVGRTSTLSGRLVHGPPSARFLYLSWRRLQGAGWIERIKIPLTMSASQIDTASRTGKLLEADVTGRRPHAGDAVTWRLT